MPLTLDRILFPTDFSPSAEGAFRHAAWLADRFDAELHVLHVVEHESEPVLGWPDVPPPAGPLITLEEVHEDLEIPLPEPPLGENDTVGVVATEVVGRTAPEAILDYARDEEVDLVVMGTEGKRGWRRGVLGSVAEAVTRRAPCPVLTVRPLDAPGTSEWPPSRVLLAIDDVPPDGIPPVAEWAARIAVFHGVPLEVVHVTHEPLLASGGFPLPSVLRDEARRELADLTERLRAEIPGELSVHITVRSGPPAETVLAVAEEVEAGLLVVGTEGLSGPGRLVLGSVAEELVRTAPCPVLVARDGVVAPAGRAPDRDGVGVSPGHEAG